MGQVIQIDEARIREHLGEMVRGTVEETLNAHRWRPKLTSYRGAPGAASASKARQDTRAGNYRTNAACPALVNVSLKVPKLR